MNQEETNEIIKETLVNSVKDSKEILEELGQESIEEEKKMQSCEELRRIAGVLRPRIQQAHPIFVCLLIPKGTFSWSYSIRLSARMKQLRKAGFQTLIKQVPKRTDNAEMVTLELGYEKRPICQIELKPSELAILETHESSELYHWLILLILSWTSYDQSLQVFRNQMEDISSYSYSPKQSR